MTTTRTIARTAAEAAYEVNASPANLAALQAAGGAEMDEYLAGFDARRADEVAPEAPKMPIGPRTSHRKAPMRGTATRKSDWTESFTRRINGKVFDFSRIIWADGTITIRVWEGNTTNLLHTWATKVTYLPATPAWDTMPPSAAPGVGGKREPRRNQKRPHRKG